MLAALREPDGLRWPSDAGDALVGEFDGDGAQLVAFVGAGGKTTLLRALGAALERRGRRVLLTTTTRVGVAQMAHRPEFWSVREEGGKLVGPPPNDVDTAFSSGSFDAILVEADGARGRMVKAPADYEPVIPSRTTMVVAVFPQAALGAPIADIAHRPELVAAVAGCGTDGRLTPDRSARLIGSHAGYRKAVPPAARFLAAIVRTTPVPSPAARDMVARLRSHGIVACELRVRPAVGGSSC